MYCQYCRKRIGWLRSILDRQYCSADHRRKARVRSARALRDAGELEPVGLWLSTRDSEEPRKARSGSRNGALAAVLICLTMLVLLWAAPGGGPVATAVINYTMPQAGFGRSPRHGVPRWPGGRPSHRFQTRMRGGGGARPGTTGPRSALGPPPGRGGGAAHPPRRCSPACCCGRRASGRSSNWGRR